MIELTEEQLLRRKRVIRWAAAVFTACLLFVTFYSTTYRQMTYPKVVVEKPTLGQLTKNTNNPQTIVPKTAIKIDSEGEYVYTLEEKKQPLGDELRVRKTYVHTLDSDGTNTALSDLTLHDVKIVIETSGTLNDGDLVRLK